jgi:hypothetical protein
MQHNRDVGGKEYKFFGEEIILARVNLESPRSLQAFAWSPPARSR